MHGQQNVKKLIFSTYSLTVFIIYFDRYMPGCGLINFMCFVELYSSICLKSFSFVSF